MEVSALGAGCLLPWGHVTGAGLPFQVDYHLIQVRKYNIFVLCECITCFNPSSSIIHVVPYEVLGEFGRAPARRIEHCGWAAGQRGP